MYKISGKKLGNTLIFTQNIRICGVLIVKAAFGHTIEYFEHKATFTDIAFQYKDMENRAGPP